MSTQIRGLGCGGFVIAILLSLLPGAASADDRTDPKQPATLSEVAKVTPPGPGGQAVRRVALNGRYLLMATRRNFDRPEGAWSEQFAHLFRRRGRAWRHVRTLVTTSAPNQETPVMAIDLRDRVAAVNAGQLTIFELVGPQWKKVAELPSSGNLDLEIDSGTIVVSAPGCAWEAFRRIDGSWQRVGSAAPSSTCNQNPGFGEDIDISGDRIVVSNQFISNPQGTQWPSRVRVFEGLSSGMPAAFITDPSGEESTPFGIPVAVNEKTVFAANGATVFAFERDSAGMWQQVATLEPADALLLMFSSAVQSRGRFTAVGYPLDAQRASAGGSVGVFQRRAADNYEEIARLLASDAADSDMLGMDVDVDGIRVAAAARGAAYIFRVPARVIKAKRK